MIQNQVPKMLSLVFDLLSVGDVSKDPTSPKLKGFDTEKFVIKSGYDKAMEIDKIEFLITIKILARILRNGLLKRET